MFEGVEFSPIYCYYFEHHGVYMIAVRGRNQNSYNLFNRPISISTTLILGVPQYSQGFFILSLLAILAMLTQGEHQVTDKGTPFARFRISSASSLTSSHICNSLEWGHLVSAIGASRMVGSRPVINPKDTDGCKVRGLACC